MSVQVPITKQFVFGILFLLVILSVVEIIVRVYENFNPGCRFLEKEAFKETEHSLVKQICKDNISVKYEEREIRFIKPNYQSPTININSLGFRGAEILKEVSENTFRIFVVGGSSTFGSGSTSDETTIPGFLQKKINGANLDINVEVINAGVGGAHSFSETYYIKNILLEFNPNLFIVYDGANDVRYRLTDPKLNDLTAFDIMLKYLDNPFYRTPFMIYHSVPRELGFAFIFQPPNDEVANVVTTEWKKRWLEVCELGKKEGFKTLVIVQPMVGTGSRIPTSDEFDEWQGQESLAEIDMINTLANSLSELDNKCDGTANLTDVFDNISVPIYFDQVHTTDYGNQIIAQRLFELSLPLIQK